MAKIRTNPLLDRVCIIWSPADGPAREVMSLVYKPEGIMRTYKPDAIDPRAAVEAIIIGDAEAVMEHLTVKRGPRHAIAIDVRTAMHLFGWKTYEFYDPEDD